MDPQLVAPQCDVCKAMLARISDSSNWDVRQSRIGDREVVGPHHKSLEDIQTSAAWGCGICIQLEEHSLNTDFWDKYYGTTDGPPWPEYRCSIDETQGMLRPYSITFKARGVSFWPWFSVKKTEQEKTQKTDVQSLLSGNTGDEVVLQRARSWLSDCVSHHPSCGEHAQPDYFPPRLLQLLDEDSVGLIETHGIHMRGKYATLSYCWGRNPRHLTLNTDTIALLRSGYKISDLAKTFREALQVTRSLGIDFLWIDALCILQSGEGSIEDWQKHLAEMSVVYANCILNIAVDHGEDAEAGCFVSRDSDSMKLSVLEILPVKAGTHGRNGDHAKTSNEQEVRRLDAYYIWETLRWILPQETPLISRGWVHQERLLSPRILHFGKKQLAWECTAVRASETFPKDRDSHVYASELQFSIHGSTSEVWHRIIEGYSAASLTNPQDKLPALAGVAKSVSDERGTKYIAGLFFGDLPRSLVWEHIGPVGSIITPYRAPSWSWASREGEVTFWPFLSDRGFVAVARFDDVILEYVDDSNPFGQVRSGLMRITAPMVRMSWTDDNDNEVTVDSTDNKSVHMNKLKVGPLFSSDSSDDLPGLGGTLFFDESSLIRPRLGTRFVLLWYTDWSLYGLILAPADQPAQSQCWKRIGVFNVHINENIERKSLKRFPRTIIELV